jgi:hypothetical protein
MGATDTFETRIAFNKIYDATSQKTLVFIQKEEGTKCKYYVNKSEKK